MSNLNPNNHRNRYGATAARVHKTTGRRRRPSTPTVDIHAHIVVPNAAAYAGPHLDFSKVPLARFSDDIGRAINAEQEQARGEVLANVDHHLRDMDAMGVDIQVVAPIPMQCYYSLDPGIAVSAHRLVNEGVADFVGKRSDRFAGLGVVTLQEPEKAVQELENLIYDLGLKGVQILTNVNGRELSDERFLPFFAKAQELGAFIMMHPNGFTEAERLKRFYLNNVIGNPLDTTVALHHLILSGVLHRFPDLRLMAVHGGGFMASYWGRLDHAWGAREDAHADLPLPPSHYLRRVYIDTVVFSNEQLSALIEFLGPDRILMGTDYPFDMGEYDPIGHIAGTRDIDEATSKALTGGNAVQLLGL
jgi:aminocarboxymuconate-semialdehyde decarboxylase